MSMPRIPKKAKAALLIAGGIGGTIAAGNVALGLISNYHGLYNTLQNRDIKKTNRRILNNSRRTNELLAEMVSRDRRPAGHRAAQLRLKREPLG